KEYNAYASRALLRAEEDAKSCRQKYVGTEHLVLGLLSEEESLAGRVLTENGVTYQTFFDAVLGQSAALGDNEKTSFIGYSPKAEEILGESCAEAERFHAEKIGTEHILLALLKEQDCIAIRLLKGLSVNLKRIYVDILVMLGGDASREQKEYQRVTGQRKSRRQTSMTESFCEDLTQKAKNGALDPIIGRKEELMRVIQILSRRTKNSPCLVGEPGVGKTAIVE